MAEHVPAETDVKLMASDEDYAAHVETYAMFIALVKWTVIILAVILILMAWLTL